MGEVVGLTRKAALEMAREADAYEQPYYVGWVGLGCPLKIK